MKASTREWIAKAEEDFELLLAWNRRRKKSLWGPYSFHAQQCVEKYIKARLNEADLPIQRTHDLAQLLTHVMPAEPLWSAFLPALKQLSSYALVSSSRPHLPTSSQGCAS
jgi:HEPN domain-containing protein